ncbi:MAG: hypothetical protein COZ69_07110 [Deltaproteobacteria bacterium CG_4_8_14_3_um_filter_45_9]|nr:MAG: hypothetical protein COZ69_07110 [Deltaproteobacteria bacterium CG_4_8_14_3_um_filter_45_9]
MLNVGDRSVNQERRRLRDRLSDDQNAEDLFKGFLEKCSNGGIDPLTFLSTTRNVFDFWDNLVLNYSWEPVPIGQRFLGSLHPWKVIRHEKCQFSPTSLRALLSLLTGAI